MCSAQRAEVLTVREQLAQCPSPNGRRGPSTSPAGSTAASPMVGGGKVGGGKAPAAPAAHAAPAAPAPPDLVRRSSSELEENGRLLTPNPQPPTPNP